jgi:thiamine biosynthesis protein ThiS
VLLRETKTNKDVKMTVNGKQTALQKATTIEAYLKDNGYNPLRIAVEKNGAVITRDSFASEPLNDGDTLEIVGFVGGG